MKKLFILLSVIILVFASCKTATQNNSIDRNKQEYKTNATDDMFEYYDETYMSVRAKNRSKWLNGFKKTKGESGLIGTWIRSYNDRTEELSFYADGSWQCVKNYTTKNEINRINGTFEVSTVDDIFYIRIFWSTREYNLQYLVSDNYYCHEDSGCPI